jgi:sugar/nucleoside kinase (ribokinase family)
MPANNTTDILMIGHLTKDRQVVDNHTEMSTGGAVYYGSVALRRIGVSVAVVTRLHADDFSALDDLRKEGVRVFATAAQETSDMENIYNTANMEQRISKLRSFAGAFRTEDIPDLTAKVYLITPVISGEVDLSLLRMLSTRGPVGLDGQGFVRIRDNGNVVLRHWSDMAASLAYVTYLKLDRAEAELLTGQTDLRMAARQLASFGPREIIITQSSGVITYADGLFYEYPFHPRSLVGRTGRGDTCFATYIGKRLSASPLEACQFAAAITTLKLEQPGPWRGTLAAVEALLENNETKK